MIMRKSLAASVHISSAWPSKRGRLIRRTAILIGGLAFIAGLTLAGIHAFVPNDPAAVIALPVSGTAGSIGLDGTGTRAIVVGRGSSRSVAVLDTSTNAVVRSLQAPGAVTALVVGKRLGIAAILSDGSSPAHGTITFLATRTGTVLRRLAAPPPTSTQGNKLEIGSVAWSPDRYTLAYAVVVPGEGLASPQRERAVGVWLTRYDQGRPRQLARNAQLGIISGPIARLSWTPDGRTLAVSTFLPARGGNVPVVLAVDASSGRAHTLVHGGQDATISPTTGALAYTISTAQMTTLWVAGAQGQQPHALVRGSISSPAWAPDGRAIAYLDHPDSGVTTVIRTVNVATGQVQTVIADNQTGQPLLLADGHFQSLGWLRTRA